MTVKFKGFISQGKGGCRVCGKKKSSTVFRRTQAINMPSGRMIRFVAGQETTVSDSDGEFLLGLTYGDNKQVFERVM